jgi:hypothetical protein
MKKEGLVLVEVKNGAEKHVEKDAELKEDNYNDLANIIILHYIYMLTTKNLAAHTKKTKDKQIKDLEQQLNNLEKLYNDSATRVNDATQIQKEYSEIEAELSKIKKHRSVKKYVDDDSHEPTAMRRWLYKPLIKKEKHTLRTASTVLEKEKKKKPLRTRSDPVTPKEGKIQTEPRFDNTTSYFEDPRGHRYGIINVGGNKKTKNKKGKRKRKTKRRTRRKTKRRRKRKRKRRRTKRR